MTSELTHISCDNPLTTPVATFYDEDKGPIIIATSVVFYNKVRYIRENPNVATLYSRSGYGDSGNEPVVLVQGKAVIHD